MTLSAVEPLPNWLTLENLGGMARLVGTPPAGTPEALLIRLQAFTGEVGPAYYTFLLQIDADATFDPHPPLYNMSMAQVPGGLRMEWFGYPGIQYQLQVSDDLRNWTDLGPVRPGADELMSHEETLSVGQPRFSRANYAYGW